MRVLTPPLLHSSRVVTNRLLVIASAASLAACFRGTLPARELYRLRPPQAAAASPQTPGAVERGLAPLAVEPYATTGVYAGPEIVYRVGETRYGTYPSREWAVPLGTMLATLTAESLRRVPGGVGQVTDGPHIAGAHGLVWRGTVREFEEVDRDGGPRETRVSAVVRLDAQLVRAADDSVLWQGSAEARHAVVPPNVMTAVVDSLASAARATIDDLVRSAAPSLRSPAVQRAVAARNAP